MEWTTITTSNKQNYMGKKMVKKKLEQTRSGRITKIDFEKSENDNEWCSGKKRNEFQDNNRKNGNPKNGRFIGHLFCLFVCFLFLYLYVSGPFLLPLSLFSQLNFTILSFVPFIWNWLTVEIFLFFRSSVSHHHQHFSISMFIRARFEQMICNRTETEWH